MFTKGPRFNPAKPSEVPPPGAYNIQQESVLDNYKKGAFLEKADRFNLDKLDPTVSSTKQPHPPTSERYGLLQKKVDDLEKIHVDGKKAHQVQLEKLRQELVASQKLGADATDKLERQRKARTAIEESLQESKRSNLADQSEIKDLKHKLRLLEIERDKSSSKQPDINDLKKNVQALESKRKDELRERDRRIAELERILQVERKKRELLESKAKDSRRLYEDEAQTLRLALNDKDALLDAARAESSIAHERVTQLESTSANQEDELLDQLKSHKSLLGVVARQYGSLVTRSTSLNEHQRLKQSHTALEFRQLRLQRKLVNTEGQVLELTHLIRQVKDQNNLLAHQLHDALKEIEFLRRCDDDMKSSLPESDGTHLTMAVIHDQLCDEKAQLVESTELTNELVLTFYRSKADQIYLASTVIVKEHSDTLALAEQRLRDLTSALASHEAIATRLETIQKARLADQEALGKAMTDADNLRASTALLEVHLAEVRQQLDESDSVHAAALKKEKDIIQRLSTTIQKNRMAEDALRAEIDRLTADLTSVEGYEAAYNKLYDQVGSLIARNEIAQEEAERISRFNAEILGHKNPDQRIMYVDRIRTELAETKMQIADLKHEQDNLRVQNGDLENELRMYKSVGVDSKPRTHITRVGRQPLVNLTQSMNNSSNVQNGHQRQANGINKQAQPPAFKITLSEPVTEASYGEMTLDEII
ncbi:hypothetical protein CPB83DRAFT_875673 [Crepidotus variabilis]|uniref:Uncharacterized protein n=1 Tax=Crepidotus variabilis TaxID=179855 RepID=A0A9P6JQL0_9AGAR|nr:hypothetical protein CPB83DRAFT_875673 [Crepidotus variabilis]